MTPGAATISSLAATRRDPLLAVVRIVLGTTIVTMLVFAVLLSVTVPLVFLMQGQILDTLARQGASGSVIWAVALVVALAAIICLLAAIFLRHLYRIVASVGAGDPFIPVNADRLRAMAWISALVHLLAIPIAALGHWAATLSRNIRFDMQLPLSGMFMALILFILARVFREGARMREELDGTV